MNIDQHPYNYEGITYQRNGVNSNERYNNIWTNEKGTELIQDMDCNVIGNKLIDGVHWLVCDDNTIRTWNGVELCIKLKKDCFNYDRCNSVIIQYGLDECENVQLFLSDGINADRFIDFSRTDLADVDCCDLLLNSCDECDLSVEVLNTGSVLQGRYYFTTKSENGTFCPLIGPIDLFNYNCGLDSGEIYANGSVRLTGSKDKNYVIQQSNNLTNAYEFEGSVYNGVHKEAVDLNEILIPTPTYTSSQVSTVFNSRLLRAGLKQKSNINYQKYANAITATAFTKKVRSDSSYNLATGTIELGSFMRDENYAFAINWVFCDGTRSSSFPITVSGNTDVDISFDCLGESFSYTDANEVVPVNDPNNWKGCPAKVWEIYNTSRLLSQPHNETVVTEDCDGVVISEAVWETFSLGYTETCETYPEVLDCDGELMYGELTEEPVGLLRMPDKDCAWESGYPFVEVEGNETSPYADAYVYPMFVKFDNIQTPEVEDGDCPCISHYEIRSIARTEANSTVVSKGLIHKTFISENAAGVNQAIPHLSVNSNNLFQVDTDSDGDANCAYTFHGADSDYLNQFQGDYLKIEKEVSGVGYFYGAFAGNQNSINESYPLIGVRHNINMSVLEDAPCNFNYKINGIQQAPANSIVNNVGGISYPLNNLYKESSVYLELDECLALDNDTSYAGGQDDSQSYIFNVPDNLPVIGKSMYVSIKRDNCLQYGSLNNRIYDNVLYSGNEESPCISGDTYITPNSYRRTAYTGDSRVPDDWSWWNLLPIVGIFDFFSNNDVPVLNTTLINTFSESNVNTQLRCGSEYPKVICSNRKNLDQSFGDSINYDQQYLSEFHYDRDLGIVGLRDNDFCYDLSFSSQSLTSNENMKDDYNTCCATCLPNTIVWSEVSTATDNRWRKNLANNVKEIPADKGCITNIIDMGDELFVHTEHAIFRVFSSNEIVTEDGTEIYLGNGSLFSQEPQELFASDEGYGGLRKGDCTLRNEFGYFWVDWYGKKIFRLNGKNDIKEISMLGMRQFIKSCLPTGKSHWGYDHCYNRCLLTLGDEHTLSFDPTAPPNQKDNWISVHDYKPELYIYDRYNLYLVKDGLHTLTNPKHTNYFGVQYDWVLEHNNPVRVGNEQGLVIPNTTRFDSLKVLTEGYSKDSITRERFTFAEVYSYCNSTGYMDGVDKDQFTIYSGNDRKKDNVVHYDLCSGNCQSTFKDGGESGKVQGHYFRTRKIYTGTDNLIWLAEQLTTK